MTRQILALSLACGLAVGGTHAACAPRTPAQAEAAYTAELLRCVDRAATLAATRPTATAGQSQRRLAARSGTGWRRVRAGRDRPAASSSRSSRPAKRTNVPPK